jgi:DNA-binding FadR family transcriptional regulator
MKRRFKDGKTYSQDENIEFHKKMAAASKNRILSEFLDELFQAMKQQKLFHYNIFLPKEAILLYHKEHELIFEAVSSHKKDKIGQLVNRHIDHIRALGNRKKE